MNDYKFRDCEDCEHSGRGVRIKICRTCLHGENFKERIPNTLDLMDLTDDDAFNDSISMSDYREFLSDDN